MNFFFDTSALIKKYIIENGSDKVDKLLNEAENVYISAITEIETFSTFKRLLIEKAIDKEEYEILKNEFETDFQYYSIINFDKSISSNAKSLIEKYQLKSLDSIQLGTALYLKDEIDFFVVCDEKLIKSGKQEGLKVIDPNKK
ncbi:MAG: type II toxin-antitoxin system VapC family toxin [Spirochaetota bacterium]